MQILNSSQETEKHKRTIEVVGLESAQPRSYQSMSQFWYLHIILSNESQYQNAHQDLLHMLHHLFY